MLTANGVTVRFGKRILFEDVNIKFGKGKVLEIVSGGRDYEVTVDFEKAGVKKMFASFAKLKKVE